jgi:hypothetical protein
VPAGELVHAVRQRLVHRAAAAQVEPHGPYAGGVEPPDLVVGGGRRQLRDADEGRAEACQRVEQVRLVEPLERPGDDRATSDSQAGGARPVVLDSERSGM